MSVTFIVPVTVTDYPVPPEGNAGLLVICSTGPKGASIGNASVPIPLVTTNGKQNFSNSITVKVTLSKPAHTGDAYGCDFGSNNGSPDKGYKASSVFVASGTLP